MAILDQNGNQLKIQTIAGSDFDSLKVAERVGNTFVLSISSQSNDGDFVGSDSGGYPDDWVITVNDKLEITKKQRASGREYSERRIGEKDGVSIYTGDLLPDLLVAGMPTALIDYGDFYLIVSEHQTGIYEKTPLMYNCILYYTETVYSAYDENGKLIFRGAVDSTPDYDAVFEGDHVGA